MMEWLRADHTTLMVVLIIIMIPTFAFLCFWAAFGDHRER